MSRVIKSGGGLSLVRPLTVKPVPPPRDEERERLERRCDFLEAELRQREQVFSATRLEVTEAFARGRNEGHRDGLAEAERKDAERLSALKEAIETAQAELAERFRSLDRLALLVAKDCLDKMLDDPDYRQDILRGLITAQAAKLEASALLSVVVSAEDFPDGSELAAFAEQIGLAATQINASRELVSGACTMQLRLGALEIGLNQQWGAISDVLGQLATAEDLT
jgi:flagellar biosynthesis/type III secretory pathway protein FliH